MNAPDVLELFAAVFVAHAPLIVADLLCLACAITLSRRVSKMQRGVTSLKVFFQHAVIALGLVGSLLLSFTEFSDWSAAALAAGTFGFFMLSMQRWKTHAPHGTIRSVEPKTTLARALRAESE